MSRLFLTGDIHGFSADLTKLTSKRFSIYDQLTRDDYVIICGDFGGVWDGAGQDRYLQNWLEDKPWTTLFVDGNHENFDLLKTYPVSEWHGGKVQYITPHILHLMRGEVYDIAGFTIFCFGGAQSTDKEWRKEGESWWADELPSQEEIDNAWRNLEKYNNEVDIILTHCAPATIAGAMGYSDINELTTFLDDVALNVQFQHWCFGHYHQDRDIFNYSALYNTIITYEEGEENED